VEDLIMSHPASDLIFCETCENNIDENENAIENNACGKPYWICVPCHEKSYF
jgi:hypothetical protein